MGNHNDNCTDIENLNEPPLAVITGNEFIFPTSVTLDGSDRIYIANNFPLNSISVFEALGTNRGQLQETPKTISGSETRLNCPTGVASDSAANIYVTNFDGSCGNHGGKITVYPPIDSQSGNEAPVAIIKGSQTGLDRPSAIAVGRFRK
jgi:hypothetical protein